jgi:hypothetical protein
MVISVRAKSAAWAGGNQGHEIVASSRLITSRLPREQVARIIGIALDAD